MFYCALFPDIDSSINDVRTLVSLLKSDREVQILTCHSAAYVLGRNNFRKNNQTASIGRYSFGFMWAAMACLLLATVLFCVAGVTSKNEKSYTRRTGGRSFFSRKKSKRSRGSFIDTESQRRVKDEYN